MKKLIVILVIVAFAGIFAACNVSDNSIDNNTDKVCSEHTYVWSQTKAPTCTEDGEEKGVCSVCGNSDTRVVPALEHDWEDHEGKPATCTESGYEAYKECKRCHESTYKEIGPLGHELEEVKKAPTCTEPGLGSGTCSRCHQTLNDEVLPPLGHDEIPHDGKDATCLESGYLPYVTCSRCDYTTYEEIGALGHDWEEYEAQPATCTESGHEAYKECKRCHESTYEEIGALGHDWEEHEAKPATCTESGHEAYRECKRCHESTYKEIGALGHDWEDEFTVDKEPTETEEGSKSRHCKNCDATTDQTVMGKLGLERNLHLVNQLGAKILPTIDAEVVDESGTVVKKVQFYYSNVSFELPDNEQRYSLKLKDLPAGYKADEEYPLDRSEMDIVVTTQVIDAQPDETVRYKLYDIVHDFTLTDIDDKTYRISELFEHYDLIIIDFWKKNCMPCMAEMPELAKVYEKNKDRVFVLGVDVDRGDSRDTIRRVGREKGVTFPLCRNEECNGILKYFDNGFVPNSVFITYDGIIQSIGHCYTLEYSISKYTTEYAKPREKSENEASTNSIFCLLPFGNRKFYFD